MFKLQTIAPDALLKLQQEFYLHFLYYSDSMKLSYSHRYSNGCSEFMMVVDGEIPDNFRRVFAAVGTAVEPAYAFNAGIDERYVVQIQTHSASALEKARTEIGDMRQHRRRMAEGPRQRTRQSQEPSPSKKIGLDVLSQMLAERIKEERAIHFLSGAGVSASSIPDWNGLMSLLGFVIERDDASNMQASVASIQKDNAVSLMTRLHDTHRAFISGTPSSGHRAIGSISKMTGGAILTDNRDLLHQISGFVATHVCQIADFTTDPWKPAVSLRPESIDTLVICGMGGDRRGFIRWLKEKNPGVEIINMNISNTLSAQIPVSYFVEGDLQENLQELKRLLSSLIGRIAE